MLIDALQKVSHLEQVEIGCGQLTALSLRGFSIVDASVVAAISHGLQTLTTLAIGLTYDPARDGSRTVPSPTSPVSSLVLPHLRSFELEIDWPKHGQVVDPGPLDLTGMEQLERLTLRISSWPTGPPISLPPSVTYLDLQQSAVPIADLTGLVTQGDRHLPALRTINIDRIWAGHIGKPAPASLSATSNARVFYDFHMGWDLPRWTDKFTYTDLSLFVVLANKKGTKVTGSAVGALAVEDAFVNDRTRCARVVGPAGPIRFVRS